MVTIGMVYHLLFIFIINVPFGIWRGAVKKLSVQWFLAIHVPVIFSVLFRKQLEIEINPLYLIVALAIFFVSQRIGVAIYNKKFVTVEK